MHHNPITSSSGYTLIEILIGSVIVVSILGAAMGALTMIMVNKNKTQARILLKREGEYAVQTIVKALTPGAVVVEEPAQDFLCAEEVTRLAVRTREGQPNLFICDPETNELSLNNDSLINTELNYLLTSCSISCYKLDRAYQKYQIHFTFSLQDTAQNFELPFASEVVLRN